MPRALQRCVLAFCLFAGALRSSAAGGVGGIFSPVWHTVNDFDLEGKSCTLKRPAATVDCPPVGVLATNSNGDALTEDEIQTECTALGFGCPAGQTLHKDGQCRACVAGEPECLIGDNPFSCLGESHRSCNINSSNSSATIGQYYGGADQEQQQTMEACAVKSDWSSEKTTVLLVDSVQRTYDFPLLHLHDDDRDFGFLQCPAKPLEEYSFANGLWLFYYSTFGFGFVYFGAFAIFKWSRERGNTVEAVLHTLPTMTKPSTTASTLSTSDHPGQPPQRSGAESIEEEQLTQTGYRDNWFGLGGFALLWILSILWVVWLCLIILDYHGMLYKACSDEVNNDCDALREKGEGFYWLTGFVCGYGCVFGSMHTTGKMLTWPGYKFPGGGPQIDVIFISSWHFAVVWFAALIIIQNYIRCYFRVKCDLKDSTVVYMSKPRESEIRVASESSWETRVVESLEKINAFFFGPPTVSKACAVKKDSRGVRYIDFQCLRYTWSDTAKGYMRSKFVVGDGTQRSLKDGAGGLSAEAALYRFERVGANAIYVPIPSIFQAIADEFFAGFFLYQFSCLLVWLAFYYYPMGLCVLLVVVISGTIQIRSKRANQKKVKAVAECSSPVSVLRDGRWVELLSDSLVPGDVISVEPNTVVIADCVLLDGRCVVDESSLTGEPMPVPKISVEDCPRRFNRRPEDMKFCLLCGTSVESVSPGPSGRTLAMVLATGAQTDKGQLVREILYPPPMTFKFDLHWRVVFLVLLLWGVVLFGVCFYMINGNIVSWFYGMFTVSQVMSPLIPAVFVMGRAYGSNRLRNSANIFCVNIDRVAVAGKVRIFCFDKTGTLTKGGLDFLGVDALQSPVTQHEGGNCAVKLCAPEEAPGQMVDALACCHELDAVVGTATRHGELEKVDQQKQPTASLFQKIQKKFTGGTPKKVDEAEVEHAVSIGNGEAPTFSLVGNEVDREMFEASGFTVVDMSAQPIVTHTPTGRNLKVLRRFEFDRETMLMSVIAEDLASNEKFVFTKGSYERVETMANPATVPSDYSLRTNSLASEGYYVLGVAWKPYDGPDEISLAVRHQTECNLNLLGLIVFENALKEDTKAVITELKHGATRPVMVTGDNAQTAVKIAKECGLSTSNELILGDVIDGEVVWKDMKTGSEIKCLEALHDDFETNKLELAVTGHAFDCLCDTEDTMLQDDLHKPCINVFPRKSNSAISSLVSLSEECDSTTKQSSSEMHKLLRYTRVFARMKPNQKVEAVKMHMEQGITGMCGDGANDAGALRMAHVGLALASGATSATVVAPFSTPKSSLTAVTTVLKEGRAALANSIAGYKNLMMYGELMAIISLTQYYFGAIMSLSTWMFIDVFINIPMAWAIMQAKAAKKLAPYRPTCKLIGLEVCASVISQILLCLITLIVAISLLFQQEWFVCKEFDANLVELSKWWLKGDNYESLIMAQIILVLFINQAAVFNLGFDYRRKWGRNYWLVLFWLAGLSFCTYLIFSDPSAVTCLFRMNCGDNTLLEYWGETGQISYTGPISTAPAGCPCSQQVDDNNCEAEYINCTSSKYNQTYHHNIVPSKFRWIIFAMVVSNIIASFAVEQGLILGPLRRYLRRRKVLLYYSPSSSKKKTRQNIIIGTANRDASQDNCPVKSACSISTEDVSVSVAAVPEFTEH